MQTFWHITLDPQSSFLTACNTPLGKFRWLRLPFGLKLSRDVFEERLDKALRLLEGVLGITDDILMHGMNEVEDDGRLLTLFETARLNNLTLNPKKMQLYLEIVNFLDTDWHCKALNQIQKKSRQF